jgi:hypothetical protein
MDANTKRKLDRLEQHAIDEIRNILHNYYDIRRKFETENKETPKPSDTTNTP